MARITTGLSPFTDAAEIAEDHDLTGRTVVITGAATGIGIETARALAAAGAEVTIAVRNREAGEKAAAEINGDIGSERVKVGALDLSDLASVAGFVSAWGDAPLNVLINNAGVMACPQTYTADDLEMQIGTNHFGHFLLGVGLTRALMNGSEEGRSARLVSLSSGGHRRGGINWDDVHYRTRPYDKWESYGQSKTANALFAVGYHKRFADLGITANSVMPGGIMTPLQRHMAREEMIALGWMNAEGVVREGFKTPAQGASTSVWAAIGPELEGVGGLYLENLAEAVPFDPADPYQGVMPHALDPESAERLWALSEDTTGVKL
ncbi:SDR family NAD(P)-dependent oxidoreductase [Phenylobacterium sp. 20VBR1]|uniref:Probable oxidoreductase n=1 Tax=Phenylobacterium glaciei TaxID=2803784 RepID=A0A941HWN6_9CAUL|nr:oxidoreductase [Phenylobacterium glaciei]MBR7621109.1 SDR family NAD(P)-dependent oxidoreductase [Phenylobacterium glaciei]